MADEFTPINTQEEFEARVTEVYGNVKDLQGQITTLTGERDTLQSKVKGYETTALKQRIAQEKGIPAKFAARLSGETEADIKADADAMASMLREVKGPAPLYDPTPKDADTQDAALRKMLQEMEGV